MSSTRPCALFKPERTRARGMEHALDKQRSSNQRLLSAARPRRNDLRQCLPTMPGRRHLQVISLRRDCQCSCCCLTHTHTAGGRSAASASKILFGEGPARWQGGSHTGQWLLPMKTGFPQELARPAGRPRRRAAGRMILTGAAIAAAIEAGDIVIDPFEAARLSPNAYDWRLGDQIRICRGHLDAAAPHRLHRAHHSHGMILRPGGLYLGLTHERTGSQRYAQLLNGDRTTGALGIWVHVSAPLGHVGHAIAWTLEIRVARPVRVYPRMTFGKLVFLHTHGEHASYQDPGQQAAGPRRP